MKNTILKITTLSIIASSLVYASGYRLPEQSTRSVATSGAYLASSHGATASYYNPANMSFNKDKFEAQASIMQVHLSSIHYKDDANSTLDSQSKVEDVLVPTMFFSSKDYNNIRYGFNLNVPAGLSKRWDNAFAKTYAQEFTLKVIELNPTVAYKLQDNLSIGAGLRFIYSEGIVKSDGTGINKPAIRDMQGEVTKIAYNLALAYKPTKQSNISVTYRSKVDLDEEGNAKLYLSGSKLYDGGASVSVPLPAVLSLSYSILLDKINLEFTYDKTYWSAYKNLDFEYKSNVPLALQASFDAPKPKNWEDTKALRLALSYQYNNNLNLMFGYAKDENPVPQENLSFELPDSDATLYSFGFDYKLSQNESIGFGYLYDKKDKRKVKNYEEDGTTVLVNGEFSNATAQLISFSYRKAF